MEEVSDVRISDKNIMDEKNSYRFLYACDGAYVKNKVSTFSKLEPVWNKNRK